MTSNPQDPIHEVPVTEIIPRGSSSVPARHSSSTSSDHEHRLPASMAVLSSPRTGPRLPWRIGIVALLVIIGAGTWYWWTTGTPPIHYKTALVDRGPITAIVTALFRYPAYYSNADRPELVQDERMAPVAAGLQAVIAEMGECTTVRKAGKYVSMHAPKRGFLRNSGSMSDPES